MAYDKKEKNDKKNRVAKLKDQMSSASDTLRAVYKILNADTFPKRKFIKSLLLSSLSGAVSSFRPKVWGIGINAATGDAGLANPQVAIFGGLAYMMDFFNGYMQNLKQKSENELQQELFINFESYCRAKYISEDKSFRNDNPLPAFNQAKQRARQSVQNIAGTTARLTGSVSQAVTSGGILGSISPVILAGVTLYAGANIAWNFWHVKNMHKIRKKFNKRNDDIYSRMGDITSNADTIQRTGNVSEYAEIINAETNTLKRLWARVTELDRRKNSKEMIVSTFFNTAVFASAYSILKGKAGAKIGDLVTLVDSVGRFSSSTMNLGYQITSINRSLIEYNDAMEILNHIPMIVDKPNAIDLPIDEFEKNIPTIEFKNVSYRYKPDAPEIFNNFNLKIPGGQKIAILGDSGAGKTSMMSLLLREYEPESGEITIGGYKNDDVKLKSLRKTVRYIPQNAGFLDRSVRDNLKLVKPDATDVEIEMALGRAKILDLVNSRPGKLDAMVGHGADAFSGGERQRLALARAFLDEPPVVVMDEPEKGLDPKLRNEVISNIKDFAVEGNGRTMIIITHDPFIAQGMDRIVILEGGKVVEDGRPMDLAANVNSKFYAARMAFTPSPNPEFVIDGGR